MTVTAFVPRAKYDLDEIRSMKNNNLLKPMTTDAGIAELPKDFWDKAKLVPASDQWNEKLRGPKMSKNGGKVIFKYQMPVLEQFTMRLPVGAEIIRMDDQDGMFWLWAVVDTNKPDETRRFHAVKCGANVPENKNLVYRGFCKIFVQQELGLYIFEDIGYAN